MEMMDIEILRGFWGAVIQGVLALGSLWQSHEQGQEAKRSRGRMDENKRNMQRKVKRKRHSDREQKGKRYASLASRVKAIRGNLAMKGGTYRRASAGNNRLGR